MPAKSETVPDRIVLDLTRPELPEDHQTFKQTAQALQVIDSESFSIASEMISRQSAWDDSVDKFFAKASKAAYDAWQSIVSNGGKGKEPGLIAQMKIPMCVRGILEPRMKEFRRKQEEERRAAEEKLRREQAEAARLAQEEADRIQRQADEAAAALRAQGLIRQAKETQDRAIQTGQAIIQEAAAMNDVGVILADTRPVDGPGEARIWRGVVDDIKETCRAIGVGEVPLTFTLPKRGGGEEEVPIVEISQKVIDYLAKRHGRADIGVKGCHGERELSLRFSKTAAPVHVGFSKEETEGW